MKITEQNLEIARNKGLIITHNKGFHIKFDNGWTVSVQFGWSNYCESYNDPVEDARDMGKVAYASDDAEVWAWNNEKHYPDDPLGYQSTKEILAFMNKVSKFKGADLKEKTK